MEDNFKVFLHLGSGIVQTLNLQISYTDNFEFIESCADVSGLEPRENN